MSVSLWNWVGLPFPWSRLPLYYVHSCICVIVLTDNSQNLYKHQASNSLYSLIVPPKKHRGKNDLSKMKNTALIIVRLLMLVELTSMHGSI